MVFRSQLTRRTVHASNRGYVGSHCLQLIKEFLFRFNSNHRACMTSEVLRESSNSGTYFKHPISKEWGTQGVNPLVIVPDVPQAFQTPM